MPHLRVWLLTAPAGLATLYHPMLGWGAVAEDFALKGARARESLGERRSLSSGKAANGEQAPRHSSLYKLK